MLIKLAIWYLRKKKQSVLIGYEIKDGYMRPLNEEGYGYDNKLSNIDLRNCDNQPCQAPRGSFEIYKNSMGEHNSLIYGVARRGAGEDMLETYASLYAEELRKEDLTSKCILCHNTIEPILRRSGIYIVFRCPKCNEVISFREIISEEGYVIGEGR